VANTTQALGTQFTIAGIAEATIQLKQWAALVKATQRSFNTLPGGRQVRSIHTQAGQSTQVPAQQGPITIIVRVNGGSSFNGGNASGGRLSARGPARRRAGVYGLAQRHRDLLADLQDPAVRADKARYQDTLKAFNRAQYQLNKKPNSKFMNAVMSTRFNIGHASPLVGRSLAALEEAGIATEVVGPLGLVAGAAYMVVTSLYDLARRSAEVGNEFSRLQLSTGGSVQSTAMLTTIGNALGISPSSMGSIAQSFQNAITSDPMARAAGMKLGVFNLPGMFGNQDLAGQMTTAITHLFSIKNPTDRLTLARQTNIAELLPLALMSNPQIAHVKPDAATTSSLMTAQFQTEAADFQAGLGRIGQALNNVLMALGPNVLPVVDDFLNQLADSLNNFAKWASTHGQIITMFFDALLLALNPFAFGPSIARGIQSGAANPFNPDLRDWDPNTGGPGQSSQSSALQANTDATRANTQAIRAMIPGTYGTTRRDIGTGLPSGLNGQSIDRANLNLSAF